jgi:hypothetical protein
MLQPKKVNKVTAIVKKPQPTGSVVAPTTASVEYTPLNTKSRERRKESGFIGSETEGVKVDKEGKTEAKPFSRKVIESPGGHTRIIGDDGTVIAEGPANSYNIKKGIEDSKKKVRVTNQQRENNARGNNLISGDATDLTQNDVDRLTASKQATGNVTDPKIKKVMANEDSDRANINSKTIKVRKSK